MFYDEHEVHPEHEQEARDLEALIGVDGVIVDIYGWNGLTVEISADGAVLGTYDFAYSDDAFALAERLADELNEAAARGMEDDLRPWYTWVFFDDEA